MHERLAELTAIALRHAAAGTGAAIPRVGITVSRATTTPTPTLYQPMLCVVLQGAKTVMIGDRALRYDTASYFVGSIEVPASGCIIDASPERPYVGLSLALDHQGLTELLADAPGLPDGEVTGFAVAATTPALLDAWARMLALLDAPEDAPVLAPLIEREMLYRLLQGPQAALLRQAVRADSRLAQVRRAIGRIREDYARPLRVEELAAAAGMSPASFHRHFRAATAMSPLQYQKSLRLQEARRLMISEADATRAGFAVGYESASQFSREYARMFGAPPARDALRRRQLDVAEEAAA